MRERVEQNKYTRIEKANVGSLLIKLNLLDQIKMKEHGKMKNSE